VEHQKKSGAGSKSSGAGAGKNSGAVKGIRSTSTKGDCQNHHRVCSGCFQSILEAFDGVLNLLSFYHFLNHRPRKVVG